MKKILLLSASLFLITVFKPVFSQVNSITIGLIATECDQIIIQWNSTYSFVDPNNQWTQSTMTLSWPSSLGADVMGLGNTTNITSLLPGFTNWQFNGAAILVGSDYHRELILLSGAYTQDIPIGITEVVAIKLDGTGTGDFALIDPNVNTDISSFSFTGQMWSGTLNPSSVTGVPLADAIRWNGTRWCGGSSTNYFGQPSSADNLVDCFITGSNGALNESNAQVRDLTVDVGADLTIAPNASLQANRVVTVNASNGLNIGADATGTGSFISRTGGGGALNYGTGASSIGRQYFVDNVTSVPFHVHLVGPLVNDPSYQTANGHLGVYLDAFNLVNGLTYAYIYDNTQISPWVNVVPTTYPIPTTLGLALSTTTNTSQTIEMTGKFVHGNITTANGSTVQNVGWNLISNPYPSGLNLENFLTTNSYDGNLSIEDVVYAWVGSDNVDGGTWSSYTYSVGGTGGLTDGKIRVGQGFFVDYAGSVNISFLNNIHRIHANGVLLKNEPINLLRLLVRGNGFSDELIVHFKEDATNYYGRGDAEKWFSMYDNATEAWTVTPDNVYLTINSLAPLASQPVSVPMSFKCSDGNVYIIEGSNFGSFEAGTEIYLEDIKMGGEWHNLVLNPVYEFTGSPDDSQERFILHFFGPTAIDDDQFSVINKPDIQIYGYHQDAYIVNRGNETVQEYVAYDMMGRELHRGTLPNSNVNKVTIGNVSAYYIVKVITKEGNVYTDKVFISQ